MNSRTDMPDHPKSSPSGWMRSVLIVILIAAQCLSCLVAAPPRPAFLPLVLPAQFLAGWLAFRLYPGRLGLWIFVPICVAFASALLWALVEPRARHWPETVTLVAVGCSLLATFVIVAVQHLPKWRLYFARAAFATAVIATLIFGFYGVENWRGERALQAYRAEREALGESFDWNTLIPPEVPDEQNFAMTPLLKPLLEIDYTKSGSAKFLNPEGMKRVNAVRPYRVRRDNGFIRAASGDWTKAKPANLPALQWYYRQDTNRPVDLGIADHFVDTVLRSKSWADEAGIDFPKTEQAGTPAQDVLHALSKFDAELGEIAAALKRPHSRFPLNYPAADGSILLPHLADLKRLGSLFRMRAIALLTDGRSEAALADLLMGYDLAQSMRTEPFLISLLVEVGMLRGQHQIVWEGLRERRWTADQLEQISSRIARIDLLAPLDRALTCERVIYGALFDQRHLRMLSNFTGLEQDSLYRWAPFGWYRRNQIEFCRDFDEMLEVLRKGKTPADYPDTQTRRARALREPSSDNFFLRHSDENYRKIWINILRAEVLCDLVQTACALERFWQEHGVYPEGLDELVPDYLPKSLPDLAANQPFRYRREGDRFVLYSVGSDGRDDQGTPAKGDWVWRY